MRMLGSCLLGLLLLTGCGDGSTSPLTEAQLLREQFGGLKADIPESAMEALRSFEDPSAEVALVQFIQVSEPAGFAAYEAEIAKVWRSIGADASFATEVFGHMVGDRAFSSVRAVRVLTVPRFLEAVKSPEFTAAMDLLAASSTDIVWALGRALPLPPPTGSYVDPDLQNLSREDAATLLRDAGDSSVGLDDGPEDSILIDMIVSDDPAPFWMANLIDFYEQAQYPDDPNTTLTGREANDVYAQTLIPRLQEYSSLPELVMDIDIVLTADDVAWELAVLHRYASRDAFLRVLPLSPERDDALEHKSAAVERTIVLATE